VGTRDLETFRAQKDDFYRRHPQSPLPPDVRRGFEGLQYFEPNDDMVFETTVSPGDMSAVTITTSDGQERTYYRAATVTLDIDGNRVNLTLLAVPGHDGYFLPFRDATSGSETYGAGRYLDLPPDDGGALTIDFNYAYNPYCAYSDDYSCALPPHENWLRIPIRAGEKAFDH
jgi:uncharacterized protein (DUF1684 family)